VVLKEPVVGIPVTPIASGCELQELQRSGAAVRFVGFSPNNTMDNYRLKWAKTAISSISEGVMQAGGAGITACPGDSGGPLMGLLPDGSWRTIGVTSTLSGACGGSGSFNSYSRIRKAMIDWVEAGTG